MFAAAAAAADVVVVVVVGLGGSSGLRRRGRRCQTRVADASRQLLASQPAIISSKIKDLDGSRYRTVVLCLSLLCRVHVLSCHSVSQVDRPCVEKIFYLKSLLTYM